MIFGTYLHNYVYEKLFNVSLQKKNEIIEQTSEFENVKLQIQNFQKYLKSEGFKVLEYEHEFVDMLTEKTKISGFIDLIIQKGKTIKLIDFKFASWYYIKEIKSKTVYHRQLQLYKKFYCSLNNIDIKNVGLEFVIFDKNNKKGKYMILKVRDTKKVLENATKAITDCAMLRSKVVIKNYSNCKFCDLKNTIWCK